MPVLGQSWVVSGPVLLWVAVFAFGPPSVVEAVLALPLVVHY